VVLRDSALAQSKKPAVQSRRAGIKIMQFDPTVVSQDSRIRPAAAAGAQGEGFDEIEATTDPSLPALTRLGFS